LRADSGLISLSIVIFITAMLLEGLQFLPVIGVTLEAQVQIFTAYVFVTSMVVLALVGIASVFKRKF
jgi:hypothetical protein